MPVCDRLKNEKRMRPLVFTASVRNRCDFTVIDRIGCTTDLFREKPNGYETVIDSRLTFCLLHYCVFVGISLGIAPQFLDAADWPRWRGPAGTAVSVETDIATTWPADGPPMLWQAVGVGEGYSSVVTANGVLFTAGRVKSDVMCSALDASSGELRWTVKVGTTKRNVMSTPTVHDGLVYVIDPDGELVCLDAASGNERWQRSFVDEFGGRLMSGRGYGESPLIDGARLLCTPSGAEAMVVALDRRTGQTIWTSRFPKIDGKGKDGAAFSSLNIMKAAGVRQIVQLTGRGLVGIAATDGRFLWSYNDISNQTANIPTPIVVGDLVFSANGYHAGSVLLKIEPDTGPTGVKATEVYRLKGNRFQNHHGGFALIDGHVFGGHGSNNGLPTCLDLSTGKIRWKRRGPGRGSASVVAANRHLVFRYQDGTVCLIEATPDDYRLRGTFQTPSSGGDSWSHPVISNGVLFLRDKDQLWAYDIRPAASAKPNTDTPPAIALKLDDSSVRMLSADQDDPWPNRLYQFAFEATADERLALITLGSSQIDEDGSLKDAAVEQLQKFSEPFVLSVGGTSISTSGFEQLARLKRLVGLDAGVCRGLNDESLMALAASRSIRLLIATDTPLTDDGLKSLSMLPTLIALDLEACDGVTDSSCTALASLTRLRGLSLRKTGFEKQRVGNGGLQHLAALKYLEVLDLEGNAVTDDGLKLLSRFSELRELNLNILPITDAGMAHLSGIPKLKSLSVRYSEGFAGVILTNAGVQAIAKLSTLTSLNLTGARRVTDASVQSLKQLQDLHRLNLSGSGLSKNAIRELRKLLPKCAIQSSVTERTSE